MPPLTWRVHRARETPVRTAITVVFIALFVVFTWISFGPLLAVVALVVLLVSVHTYFLPVSYRFDEQGVEVDKVVLRYRYEWGRFRRWFRTTGGIVLSPFSARTWLDNFRGVHLLVPKDDAAIAAYLDRKFAPPPPDDRLKLDETTSSPDG